MKNFIKALCQPANVLGIISLGFAVYAYTLQSNYSLTVTIVSSKWLSTVSEHKYMIQITNSGRNAIDKTMVSTPVTISLPDVNIISVVFKSSTPQSVRHDFKLNSNGVLTLNFPLLNSSDIIEYEISTSRPITSFSVSGHIRGTKLKTQLLEESLLINEELRVAGYFESVPLTPFILLAIGLFSFGQAMVQGRTVMNPNYAFMKEIQDVIILDTDKNLVLDFIDKNIPEFLRHASIDKLKAIIKDADLLLPSGVLATRTKVRILIKNNSLDNSILAGSLTGVCLLLVGTLYLVGFTLMWLNDTHQLTAKLSTYLQSLI
ncbi:MAG: hypothetical protein ACJA0H_001624 [Francisellaceae bacterium]